MIDAKKVWLEQMKRHLDIGGYRTHGISASHP